MCPQIPAKSAPWDRFHSKEQQIAQLVVLEHMPTTQWENVYDVKGKVFQAEKLISVYHVHLVRHQTIRKQSAVRIGLTSVQGAFMGMNQIVYRVEKISMLLPELLTGALFALGGASTARVIHV